MTSDIFEGYLYVRGSFFPLMTVYTRTDEGQVAAYDPQSALPRKLKSLLKLIDGKTSLAILEESLRAFGDVRGLVQSLDSAGLIEPMTDSTSAERSRPDYANHSRMSSRASEMWPGSRSPFGPSQMSTRFAANAMSDAKRAQALRRAGPKTAWRTLFSPTCQSRVLQF